MTPPRGQEVGVQPGYRRVTSALLHGNAGSSRADAKPRRAALGTREYRPITWRVTDNGEAPRSEA
ncbi:hypothetical protein EYF80_060705 [Liparis tanakae]|uniref:Uncharacterized protein n=1 Tax=Liparis tanakae TaxID=230148 RepID=A0A4Z2EJN1_9TELE|nr:hypothetical protein EYF80_060705 [Liparis tanakae]